jgi:hypothetical protein
MGSTLHSQFQVLLDMTDGSAMSRETQISTFSLNEMFISNYTPSIQSFHKTFHAIPNKDKTVRSVLWRLIIRDSYYEANGEFSAMNPT